MATIYNEEHRRLASAKIVAIAQRILSGELGIVAGARQLSGLRFDVDAERDSDFIFFVGVDSETDHLPVGEVRSRWSVDALKAKDQELQAYEASVRESAFEVCRSLIQRYDTHDAS
jgi:hypothetical protein